MNESSPLNAEQRARVDALHAARAVIVSQTPVSSQVDVIDLVAVAQFILDGEDPFAPAVEVEEIEDDNEGGDVIDGVSLARSWTLTIIPDGEGEE